MSSVACSLDFLTFNPASIIYQQVFYDTTIYFILMGTKSWIIYISGTKSRSILRATIQIRFTEYGQVRALQLLLLLSSSNSLFLCLSLSLDLVFSLGLSLFLSLSFSLSFCLCLCLFFSSYDPLILSLYYSHFILGTSPQNLLKLWCKNTSTKSRHN